MAATIGLLRADRARAEDLAAVVAALKDGRAECADLRERCERARTAKRDAQRAMAESRANHARSRTLLADRHDDDTAADVALQDRAVQEHLTAASRHRADAAAAFREVVKLLTAKHGRRPPCGACPGI